MDYPCSFISETQIKKRASRGHVTDCRRFHVLSYLFHLDGVVVHAFHLVWMLDEIG